MAERTSLAGGSSGQQKHVQSAGVRGRQLRTVRAQATFRLPELKLLPERLQLSANNSLLAADYSGTLQSHSAAKASWKSGAGRSQVAETCARAGSPANTLSPSIA